MVETEPLPMTENQNFPGIFEEGETAEILFAMEDARRILFL